MTERVNSGGLQIAKELYDLIADEVAPGTNVQPDFFWEQMAAICQDLVPRNQALLKRRDELQIQIDDWHHAHQGQVHDPVLYEAFLREIGYLEEEGDDFEIMTDNVDEEIALMAGPQLVVPVMNARYALNAANARWGSLYDALYGTDVIPETPGAEKGGSYNPRRVRRLLPTRRDF